MGRHVESAPVEIEPDGRGRLASELILYLDRKISVQSRRVRSAAAVANGCDQRHQFVAKMGQHPGQVGRQLLRLVFVQQRVVGALGVSKRVGLLAFQVDRLFQQRAKRGKIVVLPGLLPRLLAQDGRASQFLDQRLGQLDLLVILAFQSPCHGAGVAVWIGDQRTGGKFLKLLAELRIDPSLVDQPSQQGRLLGPMLAPGRRHLRPLVPAKHRLDGSQNGRAAGVLADLSIELPGVVWHESLPSQRARRPDYRACKSRSICRPLLLKLQYSMSFSFGRTWRTDSERSLSLNPPSGTLQLAQPETPTIRTTAARRQSPHQDTRPWE